jgi:hypothetical protein
MQIFSQIPALLLSLEVSAARVTTPGILQKNDGSR